MLALPHTGNDIDFNATRRIPYPVKPSPPSPSLAAWLQRGATRGLPSMRACPSDALRPGAETSANVGNGGKRRQTAANGGKRWQTALSRPSREREAGGESTPGSNADLFLTVHDGCVLGRQRSFLLPPTTASTLDPVGEQRRLWWDARSPSPSRKCSPRQKSSADTPATPVRLATQPRSSSPDVAGYSLAKHEPPPHTHVHEHAPGTTSRAAGDAATEREL